MAINENLKITLGNLSYFKGKMDTAIAAAYVAKEAGKGLSTNDYDNTEKAAVASAVQTVTVSGENIVTKSGTGITIDLSAYAKSADLASAYRYKGTVANYAGLPTENQAVGDVYNVEAADSTHNINAGDNVAWNGTAWDNLAGIVDLSGKVDKVEGKGLSTEDYTTDEKTKLSGIETGAQVNVIESVKVDGTALTIDANKAVDIDLSGKVDVVSGKGLSTNDYTDADKAKVDALTYATSTDIDELFA